MIIIDIMNLDSEMTRNRDIYIIIAASLDEI